MLRMGVCVVMMCFVFFFRGPRGTNLNLYKYICFVCILLCCGWITVDCYECCEVDIIGIKKKSGKTTISIIMSTPEIWQKANRKGIYCNPWLSPVSYCLFTVCVVYSWKANALKLFMSARCVPPVSLAIVWSWGRPVPTVWAKALL